MTGVSTISAALSQISRIQDQQVKLNTLSNQLASGKKGTSFTALKQDVLTSQRARTEIKALDQYTTNIINGDRRLQITLSTVESFKAQADNFQNALVLFSQQGIHQKGETILYDDPATPAVTEEQQVAQTSADPDVDLQSLIDLASSLFDVMKDLLNAKDGDRYLFSGSDTSTPPLGDTSTLDSAMSAQIKKWKAGTISTTQLIADVQDRTTTGGNADAFTDTVIGYSSTLSAGTTGRVFIRTDERTEIEYTTLANEQAFRDIMVGLAAIKNGDLVPIVDTFIPPNTYPGTPDVQGAPGDTVADMKANFYGFFDTISQMVTEAVDDIDTVRFDLELSRARISDIKENHLKTKNFLLTTVADVEDVDLSEVAVRLNTLQIQIEASLAVTAESQRLSLVNFLF